MGTVMLGTEVAKAMKEELIQNLNLDFIYPKTNVKIKYIHLVNKIKIN